MSHQRQVTLPVDTLVQDEREDCYEAKLRVREVDPADARNYYLAVENERGSDRHAVHLAVSGKYSAILCLAALNRNRISFCVSFNKQKKMLEKY
jgi:hypothetical protein